MHIYLNAPLRSGIPCTLSANVLSLLLHSDGQTTNTNASERIEELWSCSVFWDADRRKVNRDPIQVARRDQIWPLHGVTTPDRELWSGISVAAQAANRVHACGCNAGASAWSCNHREGRPMQQEDGMWRGGERQTLTFARVRFGWLVPSLRKMRREKEYLILYSVHLSPPCVCSSISHV